MVVSGHVKNGMVVLDQPVMLPEGRSVRIEVSESGVQAVCTAAAEDTAGKRLLKYAGKAVGLPSDAARNHDHYLYGTAKR
jgi:hypothetical protein